LVESYWYYFDIDYFQVWYYTQAGSNIWGHVSTDGQQNTSHIFLWRYGGQFHCYIDNCILKFTSKFSDKTAVIFMCECYPASLLKVTGFTKVPTCAWNNVISGTWCLPSLVKLVTVMTFTVLVSFKTKQIYFQKMKYISSVRFI
jgi:hypothetical protein